ncbi:50S ribosomal protein L13 [Companilactobacillus zhongbaensis]|uniref:50S ribosomal protein L13 n=1 Tax=Companilactobacillus zhongbaensis TaxID=2486009 RepID=UPI000F786769|nr:50S ribosomal protein L13 [Companilactobacillus zhongbaensis]
MRTTPLAKANEVDRKWYVIDAADVALGRVSSVVAAILRGKNKPTYTPNVDTGDNVIIINAAQVKLTGKKAKNKIYYSHSDHPGGLKSISAGQKREEKPELFVEDSIRGMLPHNTLGRNQIKKLHVYAGSEHNHQAQNPEMLDINKLI